MRIAIACPTVGQTRRGYERFLTDLFRVMRAKAEVTLFKGGGEPRQDEIVVPHVRRAGRLQRLLGPRLRYPRYYLEFATFAASLLPHLARGRHDVVHVIDPPLCRMLHAARRWSGGRFGLLFTNAGPSPYDGSRWSDHVHCLNPDALEEARRSGMGPERVTMLPVGLDPSRFDVSEGRDALRGREGISPDTFVILSVTTLNRHHKRVDHLIEEASRLAGDFLLWIDGSLYPDGDPSLLEFARMRLGSRFRHTHVPSDRVGDLFRLADVMVSSSVRESFGMAAVEAAACGLTVVTHDSPHFRWLLGDAGHRVDMESPGALSGHLARWMADPAAVRRGEGAEAVLSRFGWERLDAGYLEMYGKTAAARGCGRN